MKNIYLNLLILAGFISGCVDVKIKSEIPKKTYYDLDTSELSSKVCHHFGNIGLGGISSVSSFETPNVIRKQSNGQTSVVENTLWVDNPKEMLKNILIKNALNECINLDANSMQHMDKIVFVKILFLGFLDDRSVVELSYRVSDSKLNTLKMGIIKKDEVAKNISALQELSKQAVLDIIANLK